jgi:uncharacterized protein DUF1801
MNAIPTCPAEVEAALSGYPSAAQSALRKVRTLIFATAAQNPTVGRLSETLKWGEPAYLTEESKSGSTIRLGWKASAEGFGALYFNCQTTLVETMRRLYADRFSFQANRALLFELHQPLATDALQHCIEMALTYHRNKK